MVEHMRSEQPQPFDYQKALDKGRAELVAHRETLLPAHADLLAKTTEEISEHIPERTKKIIQKKRRALQEKYHTVVKFTEDIARQEIGPAKKALGYSTENAEVEAKILEDKLAEAERLGISPFIIEITILGNIERTKIAQGIYNDKPFFWETPKESAA